jgi:hypothetical protein
METGELNINDSHLGQFETVNGNIISLDKLEPELICIEEIGTALGNICRFGGQVPEFYSVAQHSVLVTMLALIDDQSIETLKLCLVHDAAEAYLGDVIKPLKVRLGGAYSDIEHDFEAAIFSKFKVDETRMEIVKKYDKLALELEHDWLRRGLRKEQWVEVWKTKYHDSTSWDNMTSTVRFLDFFELLFIGGMIA